MPLPSSGAISINAIKTEFGVSFNDIRALSNHIGLSTPDSFSEFYGKNGSVSVSPTNRSVSSSSGSFTITIMTDNRWTASDNQSWLSLSATSGVGNATITATYTSNSGGARSGTITVTTAKNAVTITVSQAAGATTSPVYLRFGYSPNEACSSTSNQTYYIPYGQNFYTATYLYDNSSGSTNAPSGYYSQSGIYRFWNGGSFSGSVQNCST